ncbi:MAG TPA: GNAT family N-acetyltransferase [Gemmatimonadaceae bacterium]|nr:GNAT family N-acetyltransferase [Gemmatimonadaceae bacterium]
MSVPGELRTARLYMRPWRADDAALLHPVLVANQAHIAPWIPRRVSDPATVALLAERLSGFAADFAEDREWRYALFTPNEAKVLGEAALFPRSETSRASFDESDRVELGYWLRQDVTGNGFVTEAVEALLRVASSIPRFTHAEIRCDARNAPSAAIPRRLGFALPNDEEGEGRLQVWTLPLVR